MNESIRYFLLSIFWLYETESKQNTPSEGKKVARVSGEEPSLAGGLRSAHAFRLHRLRRIGGAKISRDWQTYSVAAGLSRNQVYRKDEDAPRFFPGPTRCKQVLGNARENFPPSPPNSTPPENKIIGSFCTPYRWKGVDKETGSEIYKLTQKWSEVK